MWVEGADVGIAVEADVQDLLRHLGGGVGSREDGLGAGAGALMMGEGVNCKAVA